VREQLSQTAGSGDWRDFITELRQRAKIQTYPDKL
jgi:hypothetical protein